MALNVIFFFFSKNYTCLVTWFFARLLSVEKSTNKFVLDDRNVVFGNEKGTENSSVVDLGITKDSGRRGVRKGGGGIVG